MLMLSVGALMTGWASGQQVRLIVGVLCCGFGRGFARRFALGFALRVRIAWRQLTEPWMICTIC